MCIANINVLLVRLVINVFGLGFKYLFTEQKKQLYLVKKKQGECAEIFKSTWQKGKVNEEIHRRLGF